MTHEIQQTYVNPTRVDEAIIDVASTFLKVQFHFMQDLHNPKFMRSSPSYVAYNYTSNEVAVCTQEQAISCMEKNHKRWHNYWSQVQRVMNIRWPTSLIASIAIKVTHLHQITSSAQSYALKLNLIIHIYLGYDRSVHIRTPTHKIMQARGTKRDISNARWTWDAPKMLQPWAWTWAKLLHS